MSYANVITQEIKDSLPNILVADGTTVTGATLTNWAPLGWREIVQTDQPDAGYRVGEYLAVELTPLTCKLTVKTQINIADEQAAIAAEEAAQRARQIAEAKALTKSLASGGGDLRSTSPEAVARLLLACQTVNVTWLMQIAPKVAGAPQKTGASYLAEINSAIDSQA